MVQKFKIGAVVRPVNSFSISRTLEGKELPNLQQGLIYTINYANFVYDVWWYGVVGIEEVVYSEDELEQVI